MSKDIINDMQVKPICGKSISANFNLFQFSKMHSSSIKLNKVKYRPKTIHFVRIAHYA